MKTWVIILWVAIFLFVIVPLLVMGYNKFIATKNLELQTKEKVAEDAARIAEANKQPTPIYLTRQYFVQPRPRHHHENGMMP